MYVYTFFLYTYLEYKKYKFNFNRSTTTGFEPVRVIPNGFQVHLLNHSDILSFH